MSTDKQTLDIWRDSYVRYLGYANELGESFKPIAPKFLVPSYLISMGYVICDTVDKTKKVEKDDTTKKVFTAVDTLAWQTLASVVIPGFTINRVVAATAYGLKKEAVRSVVRSPVMRTWLPTVVGISTIPVIIHPIDQFVDFALDNSTRKLFHKWN